MGEQVVAAAADGVVLGGGRSSWVAAWSAAVVGGSVVGGGTVEVVGVTTGLAVGFVALVEDEHAAAPIGQLVATATSATTF